VHAITGSHVSRVQAFESSHDGHGKQATAPGEPLYVPAAHGVHIVAPVPELKVPEAQAVQLAEPAVAENWPDEHGRQLAAPAPENVPALHGVHAIPDGEYVPAAHGWQSEPMNAVPGGHPPACAVPGEAVITSRTRERERSQTVERIVQLYANQCQ